MIFIDFYPVIDSYLKNLSLTVNLLKICIKYPLLTWIFFYNAIKGIFDVHNLFYPKKSRPTKADQFRQITVIRREKIKNKQNGILRKNLRELSK